MSNKSILNSMVVKDLRAELERRANIKNSSFTFVRGMFKGVRLTLKEHFVNALCDVLGEESIVMPTDSTNIISDSIILEENNEILVYHPDEVNMQINVVDREIEEAERELERIKALKRNAEANSRSGELVIKKAKLREILESIKNHDDMEENIKGNEKFLFNDNNVKIGSDDLVQFILNGRIMSQVVFKKFQEFQLYANKVAVFNSLMCRDREMWMNGTNTVVYQIEAKDVMHIWWEKHRIASESVAKVNDPFDGQLNRYELIGRIPALGEDMIATTLCMVSHFGKDISIKSFFTDGSLIQGIKNLEASFVFLFGMLWCGMCDVLESKVNELMRKQVSDSILVTKIDSVLGVFFNRIKNESRVEVLGSYKALVFREVFVELFGNIVVDDSDKIYDLQKWKRGFSSSFSTGFTTIAKSTFSERDNEGDKINSVCIFDMKSKVDPSTFSCHRVGCTFKHHSIEDLIKNKISIFEYLKKGKTEKSVEAAEFFKVNFINKN